MTELFTRVEIAFYPDYLNYWLRFGLPDDELDLDRRRALALFKPGRLFGYVRWAANHYGTKDWRFMVVQSAAPSTLISRISGIHPGGNILLSISGTAKVKRALAQIDALEDAGFEPEDVSPAYYQHTHNRLALSQPVTPYSPNQHRAFEAGKALAS